MKIKSLMFHTPLGETEDLELCAKLFGTTTESFLSWCHDKNKKEFYISVVYGKVDTELYQFELALQRMGVEYSRTTIGDRICIYIDSREHKSIYFSSHDLDRVIVSYKFDSTGKFLHLQIN